MNKAVFAGIIVVIIVVIFAAVVALSGNRSSSTSKNPTLPKNTLVSAQSVVNDQLVYDGLTIEVEAPVNDWVTKKSFFVTAFAGSTFGGGARSLLVVSRDDFKLPKDTSGSSLGLGEIGNVHLKGRVIILDRKQLGALLGYDLDGDNIKLDDSKLSSWEKGAVLLIGSAEKI